MAGFSSTNGTQALRKLRKCGLKTWLKQPKMANARVGWCLNMAICRGKWWITGITIKVWVTLGSNKLICGRNIWCQCAKNSWNHDIYEITMIVLLGKPLKILASPGRSIRTMEFRWNSYGNPGHFGIEKTSLAFCGKIVQFQVQKPKATLIYCIVYLYIYIYMYNYRYYQYYYMVV